MTCATYMAHFIQVVEKDGKQVRVELNINKPSHHLERDVLFKCGLLNSSMYQRIVNIDDRYDSGRNGNVLSF